MPRMCFMKSPDFGFATGSFGRGLGFPGRVAPRDYAEFGGVDALLVEYEDRLWHGVGADCWVNRTGNDSAVDRGNVVAAGCDLRRV